MFHKLTLARTGCFGDCPVYQVEVFSNGRVSWHGTAFVEKIGDQEWQLDEDHVKKLAALLEAFQVWNFEYEVNGFPATDLPSCVITVIDENGAVKEIDHYLGDSLNEMERPMTLEEFEEEMDRIIGTKAYI